MWNQLPLFYSMLDTEIPPKHEIQQLPLAERAAVSTRLIAKRFIDADTNLNFDAQKKGNPPIHFQPKFVREIRGEAATATINRYPGSYIHALYQHVMQSIDFSKEKEPVVIHLLRPSRNMKAADATVNYLSLAAQREVTDSLNYLAKLDKMSGKIHFSDNKQLSVISRTARSNASPLGRLVQQGFYDTSEIKKGDRVIIVDDHSQAGGTILSMAAAMGNKGAKVLGAITPTAHPFCTQLSMTPEVKQLLQETLHGWDPEKKFSKKLKALGMPLSTLTNHEALIIIAYATDPANGSACRKFKTLEQAFFRKGRVMEGESDSLRPILAQTPLPVETIIGEMGKEMKLNRRVTLPPRIQNVHVLDWDDFLRNEKGLNYQLMHNAIAVSARRHGKDYPFLEQLHQALSSKKGRYVENANMPILSMPQRQFSATTIQNLKFLKRDAIKDLLSNLDGLKPGLQQTLEEMPIPKEKGPKTATQKKQLIDNILWHEFRRQYQEALKPRTHLSRPKIATAGATLPYPMVRPSLMSGAAVLLDRLRRPENFISLISNRPHSDLEKELNQMRLMHYFDDVQGTSAALSYVNGKATLPDPKYKKPHPYRLEQLIEQNPGVEQAKRWHFWGDTPKDISQVLPLLETTDFSGKKLRGTLVNPGYEAQEKARALKTMINPALLKQPFKIRTKASLSGNLPGVPPEDGNSMLRSRL